MALARLARGEGSSTVIARQRTEQFIETVELEYSIDNLEPLGFILRAILQRLGARLQMRGLAASAIDLSLNLSDRRRDERRVAVEAPTNEVRSLLVLLKLSLEAAPPPAAIETIRLVITPSASRTLQADMFLPPAPAPEQLETAVARIAALCGPDRAGILIPADSYRPEAASAANSWHASAPAIYMRDYYELALADGAVYRVFRDLTSSRWHVDGIYD